MVSFQQKELNWEGKGEMMNLYYCAFRAYKRQSGVMTKRQIYYQKTWIKSWLTNYQKDDFEL